MTGLELQRVASADDFGSPVEASHGGTTMGGKRRPRNPTLAKVSPAAEAPPCPYEGNVAQVLRAMLVALGEEHRSSSFNREHYEVLAACEGLDFAAGWHLAQMPPTRARERLARVVPFFVGAARVPAKYMRMLVEVSAAGPQRDIEPYMNQIDALDTAECRAGRMYGASHLASYAGYALLVEPDPEMIDTAARDLFRAFVAATRAELGDDQVRSMLETAIAIIREGDAPVALGARNDEATAVAAAMASVD